MKQAVMISIHPKWCELIASGKKTVEVRKTRPKIDTPFKCYIYETKGKTEIPTFIDEEGHEIYEGRGQVIGEFVCDYIFNYWSGYAGQSGDDCLSYEEQLCYLGENVMGYGWHISDLKIYDKPRELSEFARPCDRPNGFTCFGCKRFIHDHQLCCDDAIKRPFQSWGYVELRE